jgi:hypothetical protein
MLDAFAATFKDAWAARDWLSAKGIPFDEKFDSWP